MRAEIEERRADYQKMSEYVREAIEIRFQLEDAGEWVDGKQALTETEA